MFHRISASFACVGLKFHMRARGPMMMVGTLKQIQNPTGSGHYDGTYVDVDYVTGQLYVQLLTTECVFSTVVPSLLQLSTCILSC